MRAGTAEILIAATHVSDRLRDCLADCRATIVGTFDEAKRALHERLFRMIVIDLDFDEIRTFDLLQHVRSLAHLDRVPVLCVRSSDAAPGISAALDRLARMLGGEAFFDLRRDDQVVSGALRTMFERHALCVLIIDPDVDTAHRLGETVEQAGHDVDLAYSATAGIDAARRLRPDVVFVGLGLPHSGSYELARRLRSEAGLRDVLIIALSGPEHEHNRARLRGAGFDHHVGAPADLECIGKLLGAAAALRGR